MGDDRSISPRAPGPAPPHGRNTPTPELDKNSLPHRRVTSPTSPRHGVLNLIPRVSPEKPTSPGRALSPGRAGELGLTVDEVAEIKRKAVLKYEQQQRENEEILRQRKKSSSPGPHVASVGSAIVTSPRARHGDAKPPGSAIPGREGDQSVEGLRREIEKEMDLAQSLKEGWISLISSSGKAEERWFRLYATSLSWTRQQLDKVPLGVVDLTTARVEQRGDPSFIVLVCAKNGPHKEHLLQCSHEKLAAEWRDAIAAAQRLKAPQSGWLLRKKKPMWFLLADDALLAFAEEQDPYSDYRAHVADTCLLHQCTVAHTSDPLSFELVDRTSAPPLVWTLTCRSVEERVAWAEEIRLAVRRSRAEKQGWLRKKGPKRYVVLGEGRLSWFHSPGQSLARGFVHVADYDVRVAPDEPLKILLLNLRVPDSSISFTAADPGEQLAWVQALQLASERARAKRDIWVDEIRAAAVTAQSRVTKTGWVLIGGKRRWLTLRDATFFWFLDSPVESDRAAGGGSLLEGSQPLLGCVAYFDSSAFSWAVRAPDGRVLSFANRNRQEATEWLVTVEAAIEQARGQTYARQAGVPIDPRFYPTGDARKRGVVQQRGRPVQLEVRLHELAILRAGDGRAGTMGKKKAYALVPLDGCSAGVVGGSSFVLTTPSKDWAFDTTPQEAQAWVDSLRLAIAAANDGLERGFEHKGWLQHKGVHYWAVVRDGKLFWFPEAQPIQNVSEATAKKWLALDRCKILPVAGEPLMFELVILVLLDTRPLFSTLRRAPPQKRYLFRTDSAEQTQAWVAALTVPEPSGSAAGARPALSGVPLSVLMAAGTIPPFMVQVVERLRLESPTTPGMFQGMASFAKIREMQAALDSGADPRLSEARPADLCGLLKQWLRQLPEPLLTTRAYLPLIDHAEDWRSIRAIVRRELPPENLALAKYLTKFFYDCRGAQDIGAIAMIFGPICLRSAEEDPPEDGSAAFRRAECIRTLITAYNEVFELTDEEMASSVGADFDLLLSKFLEGKEPPRTARQSVAAEALQNLDQLFEELRVEKTRVKSMILSNKEHVGPLTQLAKSGRSVASGIGRLDDLLGEVQAEQMQRVVERKSSRRLVATAPAASSPPARVLQFSPPPVGSGPSPPRAVSPTSPRRPAPSAFEVKIAADMEAGISPPADPGIAAAKARLTAVLSARAQEPAPHLLRVLRAALAKLGDSDPVYATVLRSETERREAEVADQHPERSRTESFGAPAPSPTLALLNQMDAASSGAAGRGPFSPPL